MDAETSGPGTSRPRGSRGRRAPEPPATGAAAVDVGPDHVGPDHVGPDHVGPDHEAVARSVALRLLTGAARSRSQLAEAMARREVPPEVAERVLDRFTEVGLVDDAEYARMLVRTRHSERGLSRRAIAVELRRRGIADDVAGEALDEVDQDDEESAARELVRRRLAATAGLDAQVRARRTLAALGRKGYPPGLVSRLVREALAAEGTDADLDGTDLNDDVG